jgi:hypothetical protein
VFEKEPGSGIWWIRYFADGQKKREKVGRKSDAVALYQKRKSEVRAGAKLSANMRTKGVKLSEVIAFLLICSCASGYCSSSKIERSRMWSRMLFRIEANRIGEGLQAASELLRNSMTTTLYLATRTDSRSHERCGSDHCRLSVDLASGVDC